jgi:hypothetical protein
VLFARVRTRRAVAAASAADATTFSPLIGVGALPSGEWTVTNAATAPITGKAWDKRARVAGCVTVIRTFTEEGRRVMRVQVRPMASTGDALSVLSSFETLLQKSHADLIGKAALSERRVELPSDMIGGAVQLAGYESVLIRGLRGMTLGAVHHSEVVSVSAYGRTGIWTWAQIASAMQEQLKLLART